MNKQFSIDFLVRDIAKPFLNENIIEKINQQLDLKPSLMGKLKMDYYMLSLPENEKMKRNKKSIKATRGSYLHRADDLLYLGESQLERNILGAINPLKDSATMYAVFDAHEKYAEAVCKLANAKHSLNPDENLSPILTSLDKIISFYLRKQGMKSQNVSSRREEKEYRAKIHHLKKIGQLKSGDRWPRKKIKNYHTSLVNMKSALRIAYLKSDLLAKLGTEYENEFSMTYNKAIELLHQLPKSEKKYRMIMQDSFDQMRNNYF